MPGYGTRNNNNKKVMKGGDNCHTGKHSKKVMKGAGRCGYSKQKGSGHCGGHKKVMKGGDNCHTRKHSKKVMKGAGRCGYSKQKGSGNCGSHKKVMKGAGGCATNYKVNQKGSGNCGGNKKVMSGAGNRLPYNKDLLAEKTPEQLRTAIDVLRQRLEKLETTGEGGNELKTNLETHLTVLEKDLMKKLEKAIEKIKQKINEIPTESSNDNNINGLYYSNINYEKFTELNNELAELEAEIKELMKKTGIITLLHKGGFIRDHSPMRGVSDKKKCKN